MAQTNEPVARLFETGFRASSLAADVAACDRYDLAPLFLEWLAGRQPVLEAGCGNGRWCAWLAARGIRSDGTDWSEELCEQARQAIPGSQFFAGDMRNVPVDDGAYGGVLALGSVEHSAEGPVAALLEFRRVLRSGGVAIVTVPYGGGLRRTVDRVRGVGTALRRTGIVRRAFGKAPDPLASTWRAARATTTAAWHPSFARGTDGWFFYEYGFGRRQLRGFAAQAGLAVVDEFVAFHDEGLLHTFGTPAARWNGEQLRVELTPLGRLLRLLLPVRVSGHMLCVVLQRP